MPLCRRASSLAVAALALVACACATYQPLSGSVRETVPRVGNREVKVTDRSGREIRLTSVRLQADSVVGLSIDDARPVALAADDVRQVEVLEGDPITSFATSHGVLLILVAAAVALSIIAHRSSY